MESGTEKELETVESKQIASTGSDGRDQDGRDMYRMGKPQQFKVRRIIALEMNSTNLSREYSASRP
jgi:hypothetical protein